MHSLEDRLSNHDIRLARHDEQIEGVKADVKDISDSLKWQTRLLISTLIAAVGGLLVQLLKH